MPPRRPNPSLSYAAWVELGARPERDDVGHTTRFISLPPRGVLNAPTVTRMPFWSVNPYIGCEFGCAYCYARDPHRWTVERAASNPESPAAAHEAALLPSADAFEHRILVKQGAADVLERQLRNAKLNGMAVVIGTATDPYQPAERRFGLTRDLLRMLLRHEGLRIGLITKSTLIARDAELLAQLSRRHEVSVNISLGSVDAPLLRRLEPRTPVPVARLRAMRALAEAGVQVGLLAAPILPGITDGREALRALLVAAKDAGAQWASGAPLRMGSATRATLVGWLERERPDLAVRYARHYGARQGVSEKYGKALHERFAELRTEIGIRARRVRRPVAGQLELWESEPVQGEVE